MNASLFPIKCEKPIFWEAGRISEIRSFSGKAAESGDVR